MPLTVRKVMTATNLASTSSAKEQIKNLERRGMIVRQPNVVCSIRPIAVAP